jgi:outer membrane protein assembly factor BamB
MLFAFAALLLTVSLACGGSAEPTANPTLPPAPTSAPPVQQDQGGQQTTDNGLVTFTDENGLAAFDLPGDWTYNHTVGDNYYVDRFTAPDGASGFIENLVYNDGTPFVRSQNGQFALDLINSFYSATGQVGDIRVSSDQIMPDGSERLEWASKSGGYSGVSFFETRGEDNSTFLMFTAWWLDVADQATLDAINNAITSYYIP